jgi:hypothetical protein
MKNDNVSLLDNDQMARREHDPAHDAKRVVIVGADGTSIGQEIASSIKESLKDIKLDAPQIIQSPMPQAQTQQIDPLVIKIPYQTVIKETEIVTIEKPIYVTEIKLVEVPTIVIQKEVQLVEIPAQQIASKPTESKLMHWLLILQTGASIILSVMHFLHK